MISLDFCEIKKLRIATALNLNVSILTLVTITVNNLGLWSV